jgi:hypothetical protein
MSESERGRFAPLSLIYSIASLEFGLNAPGIVLHWFKVGHEHMIAFLV